MARRNLGDVLHYFISEEEQAEARDAAKRRSQGPPARAPRYCLPADPERPLACTLALELAGGMAAELGSARVLATFPQSRLLPLVPGVRWEVVPELADALAAAPSDEPLIAVERPDQLGALLARLPSDALDGIVISVEAAAWGLARTLGFLRILAPSLAGLRVLGLVVGAQTPASAEELGARLSRAALRQHGIEVETLGELTRNAESYRVLLRGESLHALGEGNETAQSLRALCQRLSARRAA